MLDHQQEAGKDNTAAAEVWVTAGVIAPNQVSTRQSKLPTVSKNTLDQLRKHTQFLEIIKRGVAGWLRRLSI